MQLVQTLSEIRTNIQTLDKYLSGKHEPEYSYALGLIQRGKCFIAIKSGLNYKFYPSRFIGYIGNTMDEHENNSNKDGKETNPAISSVLHQKLTDDSKLEAEYIAYCEQLGFNVHQKKRKYWRFI